MRREAGEPTPFGYRAKPSLLYAVERPMSSKELFMAREGFPNRRNASIDNSGLDPDDDATVVRWFPLVVPLLALLPMLAVYFIIWGALVPQ
jgi:hypothetical protein